MKKILCLALVALFCVAGQSEAAARKKVKTVVRGRGARQASVQQTTIINNGVGASLGVQHFQRQRSFSSYSSASFATSYSTYVAPQATIIQAAPVYVAPVVQEAPVILQSQVYAAPAAPVQLDVAPCATPALGVVRQRTVYRSY